MTPSPAPKSWVDMCMNMARGMTPVPQGSEESSKSGSEPPCKCNDSAPTQPSDDCASEAARARVCGDAVRYVKRQKTKPPKRAILSCEGACLKGEVSRVAANILAYRLERDSAVRICSGEATTGNSGFIDLVRNAPEVIAVEGCSLRCATETLRARFPEIQTSVVDASTLYSFDRNQYFEIFDLPASEVEGYAQQVARHIQKTKFGEAAGA